MIRSSFSIRYERTAYATCAGVGGGTVPLNATHGARVTNKVIKMDFKFSSSNNVTDLSLHR